MFAAIVAGYVFNPMVLIFSPIRRRYLDDLVLVYLGVTLALRVIPAFRLDECGERAR